MKQKIPALLLCLAMLFALAACGSAEPEDQTPPREKIGISLPNDSETQWKTDAADMQAILSADFDVELRYAGDNSDTQIQQIEELKELGCKTLIVAAVDPNSLGPALAYVPEPQDDAAAESAPAESAAEESAPAFDGRPVDDGWNIIAYDRLITDCDTIDFYVGFDGYEAGYLQASFLEETLHLYDAEGPFHIELFFLEGNDVENEFQYAGAMEILQMYIDAGVLVVGSGENLLSDCAVADPDAAAARMTAILNDSYTDTDLDAILCADDAIARSITDVLFTGYTGGVFPLVTGMGCEEDSVNAILSGVQAMTLLRDCTGMAEEAAAAAAAFAAGVTPATEDSLDNGAVSVPASLFYPEQVYAGNYEQLLLQRGYFVQEEDGTLSAATDYTAGYTAPAEPAEEMTEVEE